MTVTRPATPTVMTPTGVATKPFSWSRRARTGRAVAASPAAEGKREIADTEWTPGRAVKERRCGEAERDRRHAGGSGDDADLALAPPQRSAVERDADEKHVEDEADLPDEAEKRERLGWIQPVDQSRAFGRARADVPSEERGSDQDSSGDLTCDARLPERRGRPAQSSAPRRG